MCRLPRQFWNRAGFFIYVAGYAAILVWFKWFDVYHAHFDTTGTIVVIYNSCRALFIFYLFWIVATAGSLTLRLAFGKPKGLDALEYQVLSFFSGAGIWHFSMLVLGYLNLYTVPVAIALTLPFVALSWPHFRDALTVFRWQAVAGEGVSFRVTLGAASVVIFGFLLLITKGLYPSGGHDYFTHYFQYYMAVIERGGIWPNEVWYHYYYSKGAGLFFLGMLLTDPLAPQLVTYCFMAAAAAALYLIVRAGTSDRAWPWAAAALFLAMFVNTPGWGEFEKQHEVNAAFVIAIAWMGARSMSTEGQARAAYVTGTAFAIVGAVIQNSTVAVFFGASFGILTVWYVVRRRFENALISFSLAGVAGAALLATFAINYFTTGLIDDQTILPFWRFADIEKLHNWGALLPVLVLHWGKVGMATIATPLNATFHNIIGLMRLEIFFPLLISSVAVGVAAALHRWRKTAPFPAMTATSELAVLAAMIIVTALLAITAGRTQPASFYRYTGFLVPLFLASGILIYSRPLPVGSFLCRTLNDPRTSLGIVSLLVVLIAIAPGPRRNIVSTSPIAQGWRFLLGTYSIDTAYMAQDPTSYPAGAIYAGARGAYAVAGPRTPIWSMNIQAYCMLPGCKVETVHSFTLGGGYPDVMFGTPEAARAALRSSGHNFFLVSMKLPLEDNLPRAPLFSPDTIDKFLGIRWTDGETVLLTWLGPDTKPLDAAWLDGYRKKAELSPGVASFPYAELQSIFARLNATPHPWRSIELPWIPKP